MNKAKNRIKIAILGPYQLNYTKSMGGAHIHLFDLTEQLKKYSDLEVHVIAVSNLIEHDKTVNSDDLTIHYLSSPKLPRLVTSLTIDQYKVIKKIRELDPDLIHAHCTAPLYGFPASLLSKKYPTVLTVHGVTQEEAKTWRRIAGYIKRIIYVQMDRYVLRTIRNVIVDTPYVEKKIRPLCNGNIYVIPIGINEEYFGIQDNEQEDRILFVGGIEPRKGLIHLLKAIKIVKETIPTVNLHICGMIRRCDYFNELKRYMEANGLTKDIVFLGFLSDEGVKREYSECSVFALPSQEESQGLVLVEAMAAGKPIVASDIGGIPYVVDDNETGFLVEYGNSEQLAEKIMLLLGDENLRREMGAKGKEKAKEFLNEEIGKRIHGIYRHSIRSSYE